MVHPTCYTAFVDDAGKSVLRDDPSASAARTNHAQRRAPNRHTQNPIPLVFFERLFRKH